jgi:hypothetical protein
MLPTAVDNDANPPPRPNVCNFQPPKMRDLRPALTATNELRRLVTEPGSYLSESNYFMRSWQRAYWGKNYSRLRAIKRVYDPDGLFFVHHGVGSEDWSSDGFTQMTG